MVINAHRRLLVSPVAERRERALPPHEIPRLPPQETLGGFIFFCNDETMAEDFDRCLFGLPKSYLDSVRGIRKGLPLFLYNYSTRFLHGVFEAASDGGLNLEPDAWINKDGRPSDISRYPAQVRVTIRENRAPLEEDVFRPVLFHYEPKKFRLELSLSETAALLKLFSNQRLELSEGGEWEKVRGKVRVNKPSMNSPRKRNGFISYEGTSRADLSQAWRSSTTDIVGGDQNKTKEEEEVEICANRMVGLVASESDRGDEEGVECSSSYRGSYVAALKSGIPSGSSSRVATMENKQLTGAGGEPATIFGRFHDPDPAVNSEQRMATTSASSLSKPDMVSGKRSQQQQGKPWKQQQKDDSLRNQVPLIQIHPITSLPHMPILTPIRVPVYAPQVSEMDGFAYRSVQRNAVDTAYVPVQPGVWSPSQQPVMFVGPPPAFSLPSPSLVESNFGLLHAEVLEFAQTSRPSPSARARAEAAVECVRRGVKQLWPGADVEVFGSFATGLCLPHSDVDVVVLDAPVSPDLSDARGFIPLIRSLAAEFKEHHRWCKSLMTIETASMPVIKLCCNPFPDVVSDAPVAIDVTLGGKSGPFRARGGGDAKSKRKPSTTPANAATFVHNGAAAREYVIDKLRQLPALAPLVLLMKSFLHRKGLNNVYTGGLGSFSLTLMLVFYLEQVPLSWSGNGNANGNAATGTTAAAAENHLAPSAASSMSEISDSDDDDTNLTDSTSSTTASEDGVSSAATPVAGIQQEALITRAWRIVDELLISLQAPGAPNLGSLLIGFLHIFGQEFDFSRAKIVLKGSNGSSGGMFVLEPSFQPTSLWIDDPLKPGMNVGAGSFAMTSVQAAMRDMLFVLAKPQQPVSPDKQHQQQKKRSLPHLDQLFQGA